MRRGACRVRRRRRQHLRQPGPVRRAGGPRPLPRDEERRRRPRRAGWGVDHLFVPSVGGDVPAGIPDLGRGRGPRGRPRGRRPARALPRRRHRLPEALQHRRAGRRLLRAEGRPAGRGRRAHGRATSTCELEIRVRADRARRRTASPSSSRNAYLSPEERAAAAAILPRARGRGGGARARRRRGRGRPRRARRGAAASTPSTSRLRGWTGASTFWLRSASGGRA